MPFRHVEIHPVGKERQRCVHVFVHRVGALQIAFDVDHRAEELLGGRPVREAELVERQRLLQLARCDQVRGVELRDARVVRVADGQRRGQVVELEVVFAVEARVGGELFEPPDFRLEGHFVREENAARGGQQRAVVLPFGVEVGQHHERFDVRRVDAQGLVELGPGQRILPVGPVEGGQHGVEAGFVGSRLDLPAGLLDGPPHLAGGQEQPPFHLAEQRDAPKRSSAESSVMMACTGDFVCS